MIKRAESPVRGYRIGY